MKPSHPLRRLVLEVRNLRISVRNGPAIVDGIDLSIGQGEIMGLVGESGSGKSLTALALMRLLPAAARISADALRFEDANLLEASATDLERLRGDRMSIVFQDPSLSLNPLMTIGDQIAEALQTHRRVSRRDARERVLAMLDKVAMPGAEERLGLFPHQMSGGMRQRALVAMALICRPTLLIADEPTSSLDAIVQRQIVERIDDLRRELGTAVLLITHNLALVEEIADEISVLFAGQIVERGRRDDIFENPMHPYTLALLAAIPTAEPGEVWLDSVVGGAANSIQISGGCHFARRCPFAVDVCRNQRPRLVEIGVTHSVACWRAPLEETAA